jgi:hypothetical protein
MIKDEMLDEADELDEDEEIEAVCQYCECFFQDNADYETGLGICSMMPEFDEFMDTIIEENTFESCLDLYQSKRFDGSTNTCENFKEIQELTQDERDELVYTKSIENLQRADPSGVRDQLFNSKLDDQTKIVKYLDKYVRFGNERVFNLILEYLKSLPVANTLDYVNHRLVVIEVLSAYPEHSLWAAPFVEELFRTPSNQTTRRLFIETLKILKSKNDDELIENLLTSLLKRRKFAQKMEEHIIDAMRRGEEYQFNNKNFFKFI